MCFMLRDVYQFFCGFLWVQFITTDQQMSRIKMLLGLIHLVRKVFVIEWFVLSGGMCENEDQKQERCLQPESEKTGRKKREITNKQRREDNFYN